MNRVAAVGVFGNMLLTAVKLAAGIAGNSGAMVSDAIHSLSDVFATFIAWIGTRISSREADRSHPYGHERFEVVASMILGGILLFTAVSIGLSGIRKIIAGDYGSLPVPGAIALAAAGISIVAKEAMFWYTRHYAKKLNQLNSNFKCLKYNRMVPFFSVFMNNRDHRKLMIVDGHTGFTGGMNLSDRYVNINCPYGRWKDAGVRLVGDGVWNLTLMFLEMWESVDIKAYKRNLKRSRLLRRLDRKQEHNRHTERTELKLDKMNETEKDAFMGIINELKDYMPGRYRETVKSSTAFVQPYGDQPFDDVPLSENVYLELINQARRRLYIFTPYLIMSDELTRAVCIAAKRGVDVRIVVPGIPDKKLVYRLTKASFRYLTDHGVRIYTYTPGFLHSKVMLCDNEKGVVGTVNMDYRSLFLHFEDAVYFSDAKTASRIYLDFRETFKVSHEIVEEDMKKSVFSELIDSLLQVIAPML